MLTRRISIALSTSVAALVVLVGTWFTLNYFRIRYYQRSGTLTQSDWSMSEITYGFERGLFNSHA